MLVQDLEQRYNKLRVEVQMAQDVDEPVTLDEIVRRVMRREKQAAASFSGTRASKSASKPAPAIPGTGTLALHLLLSTSPPGISCCKHHTCSSDASRCIGENSSPKLSVSVTASGVRLGRSEAVLI